VTRSSDMAFNSLVPSITVYSMKYVQFNSWVAKYYASKLSKNFGVFTVDNDKVLIMRVTTSTKVDKSRGHCLQIHIYCFKLDGGI
jgi:hypothetical protein